METILLSLYIVLYVPLNLVEEGHVLEPPVECHNAQEFLIPTQLYELFYWEHQLKPLVQLSLARPSPHPPQSEFTPIWNKPFCEYFINILECCGNVGRSYKSRQIGNKAIKTNPLTPASGTVYIEVSGKVSDTACTARTWQNGVRAINYADWG